MNGTGADKEIPEGNLICDGYVVLRQLVSGEGLSFLHDYALKRARFGDLPRIDPTYYPNTPLCYRDPVMESMLEELLPWIEELCDRKLYPTYSYYRVYQRGDVLVEHTDRPACELSLSLSLGYRANKPWQLWLRSQEGPHGIQLQPGDAVLYKGCELAHWREPFDGDYAAQVFLHYVDQHGPNREWRFDKKDCLATSPITARLFERFRPCLGWEGRKQISQPAR